MSLETISIADLGRVTGGANPPPNNGGAPPSGLKKAGKVAKLVGKRVLGPIGLAWTAYDGVSGFVNARKQGKSVGESLKDGALNAIW
jgi:hypothetical protein